MQKHICNINVLSNQNCNVQNLIKTLRTENHMSQQELGHLLGVSQQEISKLEKSDGNISLNMLSNIFTQLDTFPLITFSSNQSTVILKPQIINCLHSLMEFSTEKQSVIYELIRLLS